MLFGNADIFLRTLHSVDVQYVHQLPYTGGAACFHVPDDFLYRPAGNHGDTRLPAGFRGWLLHKMHFIPSKPFS